MSRAPNRAGPTPCGPATFLHIVDDEKFIDAAWRICEGVAPGRHRWVMFSNEAQLRHVKSAPVERRPLAEAASPDDVHSLCAGHRVVVMHSLDEVKLSVLGAVPAEPTVWWLGWGFDYYDLTDAELYMPMTLKLMPPRARGNAWVRDLKSMFQRLRRPSAREQALRRVDFFGPVIHEDYQLVQAALPRFNAAYLKWNYGTLEDDMIRGFEGRSVEGGRILVGNSATLTNNHLDAFELLRGLDLAEGQVIVPLSYGNASYLRTVEEAGRRRLGPSFRPLIDFMPIDEYVGILSTCNAVIMNHLRQQALGNIVIMLYLGAKVFLDPRNPLFANLRGQGAHVFSTGEFRQEWSAPLDEGRRAENRALLRRTWSRNAVFDTARRSLARLECHLRCS